MIIEYNTITGKKKTLELPDSTYSHHIEWGGFYTDTGVYLWYKDEYGLDKCKLLVATKWRGNIKNIKFQIVKIN